MRIVLAVGWLLIPVMAWAWHTGPGQHYKKLDESNIHSLLAQKAITDKDYAAAVTSFDDALKCLPEGRIAESRRLRLERDKAMMMTKTLPEAHADLSDLVTELEADKSADAKLTADAKSALANAQYYVTWVMRLRGHPQDEWEPEIEASRQTYRWLAEQAQAAGDTPLANTLQQDCESAIRLARMDLSELQGLSLPSQCNCDGKCCGKCNGKKPGKKPSNQPNDNVARKAGSGPPPDGSGH
jgi:hypothetical protein